MLYKGFDLVRSCQKSQSGVSLPEGQFIQYCSILLRDVNRTKTCLSQQFSKLVEFPNFTISEIYQNHQI